MRNIHILGDLVAILDPLPVGCVLDSFNSRVFYHNNRSTQEEEIVFWAKSIFPCYINLKNAVNTEYNLLKFDT